MPKKKYELDNRFKELVLIKQANDKREYTQREIAEATGLTPQTVGSYLRRVPSRFDARVIEILAAWLDVPPTALFIDIPVESSTSEDEVEDEDDVRMPIPA